MKKITYCKLILLLFSVQFLSLEAKDNLPPLEQQQNSNTTLPENIIQKGKILKSPKESIPNKSIAETKVEATRLKELENIENANKKKAFAERELALESLSDLEKDFAKEERKETIWLVEGLRSLFALIVVLGLIYLLGWFAKRYLKQNAMISDNRKAIKVLERLKLDAKTEIIRIAYFPSKSYSTRSTPFSGKGFEWVASEQAQEIVIGINSGHMTTLSTTPLEFSGHFSGQKEGANLESSERGSLGKQFKDFFTPNS